MGCIGGLRICNLPSLVIEDFAVRCSPTESGFLTPKGTGAGSISALQPFMKFGLISYCSGNELSLLTQLAIVGHGVLIM